jgi:NADP-dependent 3-hydroxy acid dehydrogenase YdfG
MPGGVLEGRVALVTGASSGLGERFGRVLDGADASVVVTARRQERLDALTADLTDPLVVAGDITEGAFRVSLVNATRARHGRTDVLVNNAGTNDDGPLEDQSLEDLTAIVDINLVTRIGHVPAGGPAAVRRRPDKPPIDS